MSADPRRTQAILWRIARLSAELVEVERDAEHYADIDRRLCRAIDDLDGVDPRWRDRNPLAQTARKRGQ